MKKREKIKKTILEFLCVFQVLLFIVSPFLFVKIAAILSENMDTLMTFLIWSLSWSAYVIINALIWVQPWKIKKANKGLG